MIDRTFHQNREDGKRNNSCSYDRKVLHQSHFFLLFDLLTPITAFRFSIEHSKEYYYRTLVIANIDNNVALTRCCESCEVWPLKIKLTLLRV